MKLLFALILLITGFNLVYAQDIVVTDVCVQPRNLVARTSQRIDRNGRPCGILIVSTPEPVKSAEGDVVGSIEANGLKSTIYMSEGSEYVVLNLENGSSVRIDFADWAIENIGSGIAYKVDLDDNPALFDLYFLKRTTDLLVRQLYKQSILMADKVIKYSPHPDFVEKARIAKAMSYTYIETDLDVIMPVIDDITDISMKDLLKGLTYLRNGNDNEGIEFLKKSADKGQKKAIESLFEIYRGDKCKDDALAFKYGVKLAAAGNKDAQHFVACCYRDGTGTKANMQDAIEYMMMAASQGKVESQRMLGAIYTSDGSKDLDKARRWLKMAANQNDAEAKQLLDDIGWE